MYRANTWKDELSPGDILKDPITGEYCLLTNGICCLPHHDTDAYHASHDPRGGGCLFIPYEGYVFEGTDPDNLTGWHCDGVRGRQWAKANPEETRKVLTYYHAKIDEMFKAERSRRK